MNKRTLLPVLILAAGSLLGMAHAAPPPASTVAAADLDVYGPLRLTAIRACLPSPQTQMIYADWDRCYNVVLDSAVRQARSQGQPVRASERRG
jgi:hypothetical protein